MTWNRSDLSRRSVAKTDLSRRSAWTKADIRQARQRPLKPVLERLGYRLSPIANDNYRVIGPSPDIVIKDHYWVCADTGEAGNAIDFLVRVAKTPFQEAIRLLLSDPEEVPT